jgi:hypothetical protein
MWIAGGCHLVGKAAGGFAGVLEMEKTEDVPVSELLRLSSGKTD